MDALLVLAVVVLFIAVAAFVARPLLSERDGADAEAAGAQLADLEARKQLRYREIRDVEVDFRSGKLSEADYKKVDAELRAEAIEILKEIDNLERCD